VSVVTLLLDTPVVLGYTNVARDLAFPRMLHILLIFDHDVDEDGDAVKELAA
jgi:hypothetical protein